MRRMLFAATSAALVMAGTLPAAAATDRAKPQVRDCGTFLECLFNSHGPRIVREAPPRAKVVARTGHRDVDPSAADHRVADQATAEIINWTEAGKYKPGSIIVRTPERRLYYVLGDGRAVRYKIGVGREGFQWSGNSKIVAKQEWPDWHPPKEMIAREAAKGHQLPDMMEGGPDNPLGARAMYIGGTMFRIHGTNNPGSIGGAVSSGCIRMMNTDVSALYDKVRVGAQVYVYQ